MAVKTWTDATGKEHLIKDMDISYLCNVIRHMRNNAEAYASHDWSIKVQDLRDVWEEVQPTADEIHPDDLFVMFLPPSRPYRHDHLKYLEEYCDHYIAIKAEIDKRGVISDVVEFGQ